MQLILTVLHLMLAIGLIGLILIQHGRGADAGAAFGSGASATVFGAQGSGSFLSRSTAIMATLFFLTSMALAYFAAQVGEPGGLMDGVDVPAPIVIDRDDLPVTDLPPGPASALPAAESGVGVDDLPAVQAPPVESPASGVDSAADVQGAGADIDAANDAPPPASENTDSGENTGEQSNN